MTSAYEVMNVPAWMDYEWRKASAMVGAFSFVFGAEARIPAYVWEEFNDAAGRMDEIATLLTTQIGIYGANACS